jgi:hypothetical protein
VNGDATKLRKVSAFERSIYFIRFHYVLHQESLCARSSKMDNVIDTVIEIVSFVSTALSHCERVGLLEETQCPKL